MPTPGSAAAIQVRYVQETTQGTTPAGAMAIIPFETFSISGPVSREQPGNVRSDRQVADNPAHDIKVSGTGKSDYGYSDYDLLFAAGFASALTTPFTLTALTISATSAPALNNTAAGNWGTLSDGDLILVTGFTTNPAVFLAHVSGAPGANLLTLDGTFTTLSTEAAGASITVQHAGRFRLGVSTLTGSFEEWNTQSGVGKAHRGIGVNQVALSVPYPNKCSLSFSFTGLTSVAIGAQLANATTSASGKPLINSNVNFGDASHPTAGLGFRYGPKGNTALLPSLRIKSLTLTVQNPLDPEGGAGTLGPVDISLDKRFDVKLSLEFFRNSAAAETLIADAEDSTKELGIGFGFRDNSGTRLYWLLPCMQPSNESTTGVNQTGREMGKVEYMGKVDGGVTGMLQLTKFA